MCTHAHTEWGIGVWAEEEAGSLLSKEPDTGLDPGPWDHDARDMTLVDRIVYQCLVF